MDTIDTEAMVRYLVKRAVPSAGGDAPGGCRIRDEKGREAFFVAGRLPPARHLGGAAERVSFRDPHGRELACIRRAKLSQQGPALLLYYADELQAVVRPEQFNPSRCPLAVDAPGPDDLHACGDLPGLEYAFTRDGHAVATVSRSGFRPPDGYGVDVSRGEDDLLILASTVLIDLCCGAGAAWGVKGAADSPTRQTPTASSARSKGNGTSSSKGYPGCSASRTRRSL